MKNSYFSKWRGPLTQEEAEKAIKVGWQLGVFSAVATAILIYISPILGITSLIDSWAWIDVLFGLLLSYGIYRKNRAAAVVMLIYSLASKLMLGGSPAIIVIFGYAFYMAVRGTYAYHALKSQGAPTSSVSQASQ